tara:strand:+ start:321 stop:731 length:411 start_codon:yes stop_codon:yes gene_type:complete
MNSEIDQEYVNRNIDKIIEFMIMIEPENTHNTRNWRKKLLKNWTEGKSKYVTIAYQKYTQGENAKKNYIDRVDKFYEMELELNERCHREAPLIENLEEQILEWRKITQELGCKLKEYMSARQYLAFVDHLPSYYGL